MTQVDRFHPGDIFITAVVVATQIALGRYWLRHVRRAFPPAVFRAGLVLLIPLWIVSAANIVIGLLAATSPLTWLAPSIRAFASAVAILWGLLSAIAIAVFLTHRLLSRRLPVEHSPTRRRVLQTVSAAAVAAPAAVIAYGGFIERHDYRVREIDFPIPNLHPDLEGLRIAQISDLHVSPFLSVREAGRVVDIANELRPHLTLVTGDLISGPGDPLDATILELARLRADMGVLGCLGNHEVYAMCEDYATLAAARHGIEILRGQAKPLRRGAGTLNIAGVDYERFANRRHYLAGAESLTVPGAANILLSHNPDVFPAAVAKGYDAVIGGHTHGGQVTMEVVNQTMNLARFFTPYVAGLYRIGGRSCYVNTGIGTIGMPVRLGAEPEIALLRLRRA